MTTITRRLGTTLRPGRPWPPTRPLGPARTGAGARSRVGLAAHTQTEAEGDAAKSSPRRSGQHLAALGAVRRHRFTPSTRPGLRRGYAGQGRSGGPWLLHVLLRGADGDRS